MKMFDVIIIGGGPGGYVAAIRATQLGMRTALIEKMNTLGGTCLNVGCIPSKAMLDSSHKYHSTLHELSQHGIVAHTVSLKLKKLIERKNKIVEKLTHGISSLIKSNNIHYFNGIGILQKKETLHEVLIYTNPQPSWESSLGGQEESHHLMNDTQITQKSTHTETIQGTHIILATGSIPAELPFIPFNGKNVLSSTGMLSLSSLPSSLSVIGAGAIGLELAMIWASLGTKVTIIEKQRQILPGCDSQVARTLQRELKKLDIQCILNSSLSSASSETSKITLHLEKEKITSEKVLVAIGRKANIQSAGIQHAGIKLTEDKRISVNENYETNIKGIYAIGDLIQGPMLAHKAEDDGIVAIERINGIPAHFNYETIPSVVYTQPEVASVGISEDDLKRDKKEYKKGVFNIGGNGRALAMGIQSGFVKILAHPQTDKILGAHIVGPEAGNLISEIVTVMEMQGSSEDIARIVHAHPTLTETIKEAALDVHKRSLHNMRK